MRALYQPLAALLAVAACAACGGGGARDAPPAPPRSWPLPVFLDSLSYAPVDVAGDGTLLAAEVGVDSARAVWIRPGRVPEPVFAAPRVASRPLALLPGGVALVEYVGPGGAGVRLAVVENGAARPFGEAGERLLGSARDGRTLWSARGSPAGDEWIETTLPQLARRVLERAPAGFAWTTVADSGRLGVARRPLHDEADEIVLVDRRAGERRLLLPTGGDGRFAPLLFDSTAQRLLVAADDASDQPRAEWIELATGTREVALDSPCAAIGARLAGERLLVELACEGRRELAVVGADAAADAADRAARLPAGVRAVAALPAGDDGWWIGVAGPAAARDLLRLPARRPAEPATWGMSPRLDPSALPRPGAGAERGPGPAEIWPAHGAPRGALVWLEGDERPPAREEFDPFLAHLASHGVTVLRLRPRGADGFGRAFRRAGDGDPLSAALADLDAAGRRLALEPILAGLPLLLIGEGPLAGAAAVAAAALERAPWARVVALDPDPDPLAILDVVAAAPEPARSRGVERWGDPADPRLAARRAAASGALARARAPILVVLEATRADATARAGSIAALAAAGAPVRVLLRERPALAPGPGRRALEETWSFLSAELPGER